MCIGIKYKLSSFSSLFLDEEDKTMRVYFFLKKVFKWKQTEHSQLKFKPYYMYFFYKFAISEIFGFKEINYIIAFLVTA